MRRTLCGRKTARGIKASGGWVFVRVLDSVRIRGDGRTAEMVTEQVGQRPIRADGETRRAREVIFGDRRPLFLVMLTDIIRGHTTDDGFYLLSIAIIGEGSRRRARHRDETAFGVITQVVFQSDRLPINNGLNRAVIHIPVGVMLAC